MVPSFVAMEVPLLFQIVLLRQRKSCVWPGLTLKASRVPGVVQRPWVATFFLLMFQSIIFCFCSVSMFSF